MAAKRHEKAQKGFEANALSYSLMGCKHWEDLGGGAMQLAQALGPLQERVLGKRINLSCVVEFRWLRRGCALARFVFHAAQNSFVAS
jgi:hypothetical protein